MTGQAVLALDGVGVRRDGRALLHEVTWRVATGERWVVLGPNGSGKTTLVRVASLYLHPTAGRVRVLGQELGRTDVRTLRRRIGTTSAALADLVRPDLSAADVVMTARFAALEPWWHTYDEDDRRRARELLGEVGCAGLADRTFGTLSSGERQRVLLARTLMSEPDLVLLDEPAAGLDLGGREQLVRALSTVTAGGPPVVLVTHHVDEIPPGFTHLLVLREGAVAACGPLEVTLRADLLSDVFGVPLRLRQENGRWTARVRG